LKVFGFMKMEPRTTASLDVSAFLVTSTILARPFLSKWVSLGIKSSRKHQVEAKVKVKMLQNVR